MNIGVDIVTEVIDDLISNNIIVNKGKGGKDSFFIVDEPSDSEEINVKNVVDEDISLNALGELIDEKFYAILVNKIESEVKLALNDNLNYNIINKKESNVNDILITSLREEIKFLRDELKSKDEVTK